MHDYRSTCEDCRRLTSGVCWRHSTMTTTLTVPADDPRDALAQGERELMTRLWGMRLDHDALTLARNILADGSRYLSPAQAAEQDRLAAIGAAVERLPAWSRVEQVGGRWRVMLYNSETNMDRGLWYAAKAGPSLSECIAYVLEGRAALDEPVTGEPERCDCGLVQVYGGVPWGAKHAPKCAAR